MDDRLAGGRQQRPIEMVRPTLGVGALMPGGGKAPHTLLARLPRGRGRWAAPCARLAAGRGAPGRRRTGRARQLMNGCQRLTSRRGQTRKGPVESLEAFGASLRNRRRIRKALRSRLPEWPRASLLVQPIYGERFSGER